ncbi:MAG: ankyrin repeat domain-containing protein, partial [Cytophagales bacterium]|nr:ankyrin repeat domain-containing protein [Cytophagales bacterium]
MKGTKIFLALILTISCVKRETAFSLSKMLEVSVYNTEDFTQALEQGDLPKVQHMVEENKIDVNEKVRFSNSLFTPLQLASAKGHKPVVEFLLHKGAKLEQSTRGGMTALHLAAKNNHEEVVGTLINSSENTINAQDTNGKTPLHWAAENGCYESASLLLDKGKVDTQDKIGRTALIRAAIKGQATIVSLLLQKGAKVDIKDDLGRTALIWAGENQHSEVVSLLQEYRDDSTQIESSDTHEGSAANMEQERGAQGPSASMGQEEGDKGPSASMGQEGGDKGPSASMGQEGDDKGPSANMG